MILDVGSKAPDLDLNPYQRVLDPVKKSILKELCLTSLVPPIWSSSSSLCSPLIFSSRSSTSSFIAYTQRRINYYLILQYIYGHEPMQREINTFLL
jgi:hypothetical protein